MADKAASTYPDITPVLTDKVMGIDDPAGAKEVVLIEITALMTLLQASYDARYFGTPNIARTTSNFTKTSSTTLANITGLSVNVEAAGVYKFRAVLFTTSGTSGGVKSAISGTCTATSIAYVTAIKLSASGINHSAVASALDTSHGNTAIASGITIEGTITVADAGTLTVQFAQNASNGTASTVYAGSTFEVDKIG